jgi:hypothetical protein
MLRSSAKNHNNNNPSARVCFYFQNHFSQCLALLLLLLAFSFYLKAQEGSTRRRQGQEERGEGAEVNGKSSIILPSCCVRGRAYSSLYIYVRSSIALNRPLNLVVRAAHTNTGSRLETGSGSMNI